MSLVLSPVALEVVPGHAVHRHRGVQVSHQERAVRQQPDLALDAVKPAREIVGSRTNTSVRLPLADTFSRKDT